MNYRILLIFLAILCFSFCLCDICSPSDRETNLFNKSKSLETPICRYRNFPMLYPPDYWLLLTGGYCYNYTNPTRFHIKHPLYLLNVTHDNGQYYIIPYININGSGILFDYHDERYTETIKSLYIDEFYYKQWIDCAKEAEQCCNDYFTPENVCPNEEFPCPAVWDGWTCYPPARAGSKLHMPCPSFIYSSEETVCQKNSEKECFESGMWNQQTDYTTCAIAPVLRNRHNFHITVLSVSLGLTIPALIIYFSFEKLRTFRIALHRNLLLAIIVKNCLVIMSKKIAILDALNPNNTENYTTILDKNSVACRVLAYFESVSKNAIFVCMLLLAYFLHKLIVRIFSKNNENGLYIYWVYLAVILVSMVPSTTWAILMGLNHNEYCWMVDNTTWYQWITDGFKYFILAVNTLLLLDIARVLFLKRANMDAEKFKSAAKATIFLIPLFGIPLLFTAQRSLYNIDNCVSGDIYYYFTYSIEAAQGIVVALLFCYLNNDVHNEIKGVYIRFVNYIEDAWSIKLWRPKDNRRKTATTNVRSSVYVEPKSVSMSRNNWETFT